MTDINLNGLRMNAVDTDDSGVSNADTMFEFYQEGASVWAFYAQLFVLLALLGDVAWRVVVNHRRFRNPA